MPYRCDLSHEEMISELRLTFQKRVGGFALTPFTITPEEASAWVKQFPIQVLLASFTSVGKEIQRARTSDLVYIDEQHIMEMTQNRLLIEDARDHKARDERRRGGAKRPHPRTREADHANSQ